MKKVYTKFTNILLVLSLLFAGLFSTITTSSPVYADPIPSNAAPSSTQTEQNPQSTPGNTTPDNPGTTDASSQPTGNTTNGTTSTTDATGTTGSSTDATSTNAENQEPVLLKLAQLAG